MWPPRRKIQRRRILPMNRHRRRGPPSSDRRGRTRGAASGTASVPGRKSRCNQEASRSYDTTPFRDNPPPPRRNPPQVERTRTTNHMKRRTSSRRRSQHHSSGKSCPSLGRWKASQIYACFSGTPGRIRSPVCQNGRRQSDTPRQVPKLRTSSAERPPDTVGARERRQYQRECA